MNVNFDTITSLQCRVKSLEAQVRAFRTGEKHAEMTERIRLIAKEKDSVIKRLQSELSASERALCAMRGKWFQVFEDTEREHKKELDRLHALLKKERDKTLETQRTLDAAKDKLLERTRELYGVLTELEDEKGKNLKLTAQLNRDYENSGIPSSAKANRKKIANSREKTGKKPGGQPGHKGHSRKRHEPTERIEIPISDKHWHPDYRTTGRIVTKQLVDINVILSVTEYFTPELRDLATGQRVHADFPDGLVNEVTYGGGIKAFAYLLNNRCMTSIDNTRGFMAEITDGRLQLSRGMVNGLAAEFGRKTEKTKQEVFHGLLAAPVMNTDFTSVKLNGKNINISVCANPGGVIYSAREHKGHQGVKGTPLEDYQGIAVHDHDKTFYSYGSGHQECLAHVLRYLKGSMENEPGLKWNGMMRELLREAIRYRNGLPPETAPDPEVVEKYEERYRKALETAKQEYGYEPPSKYYKEGYNLYLRLDGYMENHLLFLHDINVPPTNNLAERLLRPIKRKLKQVMTFRSFDSVSDLCDCMSVIDTMCKHGDNLYRSVASVFHTGIAVP